YLLMPPGIVSDNPVLFGGGRNKRWWTHLDSNQGPLACEASALTGLSYASTGRSRLSRRARNLARLPGHVMVAGRGAICVLGTAGILVLPPPVAAKADRAA